MFKGEIYATKLNRRREGRIVILDLEGIFKRCIEECSFIDSI